MTKIKMQAKRQLEFYNPERDGVTFSLLNNFQLCRERTRLGLRGVTPKVSGFAMVFGDLIHWLLQEIYEDVRRGILRRVPSPEYVKKRLQTMESLWKKDNPFADPMSLQHFELTMLLAESLMPLYFQNWATDFSRRWTKLEREFKIPIEVEHRVFDQPMKTFLRGKMDASFHSAAGRPWLFETKTKSRMDEGNLVDILPFELQVNLYMYALRRLEKKLPAGVLYNVIRRPGLRLKQSETIPAFAQRIIDDIKSRPDWYFVRMEMKVERAELDRFEGELFDLIGDFLAWWRGQLGHWKNSSECENKYGTCWALGICNRKDYTGTFRRPTVFRELTEVS